jgi:hypothetical protein
MSIFINPLKSNKVKLKEETQNQINKHKKSVIYLEAAIKNHIEAIKYQEDGNHELAMLSGIEAQNNIQIAIETQKGK